MLGNSSGYIYIYIYIYRERERERESAECLQNIYARKNKYIQF